MSLAEQIQAAIASAAGSAGATGYDGVQAYGGYLTPPADDASYLRGTQRWRTFAKIRRRAPASIATQLRAALFSGVQWDLEPNEAGGPDAERGVEVVRRGLLEARFNGKSWPHIVARAADGRYFLGHSVFATALGRTASGLVKYTDIAHRPQSTLDRWLRADPADETTPFVAVTQRSQMGREITLDLADCFYLANDIGEDSPTGRAALADVAERWDRAVRYEAHEGTELFTSLGGTPVARIPQEELRDDAEKKHGTDAEKVLSFIRTRTAKVLDFVAKRIKDPDVQQWLALSSATYKDPTTGTYSSVKKWDVEIVKGELQGLAEVRKIITDFDLDMARMLGVEFVFVGGGDTAGTFGMHESKISMLGATLSSESWSLARAAEDQLCRRLVAANGLDPDTCTPSLVPSPIAVDDVLKATQALVQLNAANLAPGHPARRTIFDRLHLPYQEETAPIPTLPGFGGDMPAAGDMPALPTPSDVLGDPPTPAADAPPSEATDPKQSLNGAQVTSMVEVITAVVEGRIPREAAATILQVAFGLDESTSTRLLGPVGFEPTPAAAPAPVAARKGIAADSEHPLYDVWVQMRQRCQNTDNKDYANYGGRGIKVCARWDGEDGFANFVEDMGSRPGTEYTLERVDVDGDYTPSNCEWATRGQQASNRQDSES